MHPPSLSKNSKIRQGVKSDLIPCLKKLINESDLSPDTPNVEGLVIDGAVLTNQLKPEKGQTFAQYAADVFYVYVKRYQFNTGAKRVDLVYDRYFDKSLKAVAREKRGIGTGRKVTQTSMAPSNWKGFLRVDENKPELFRFLSNELFELSNGDVISAFDNAVTSNATQNVYLVCPTDHEEADTRIFLHVNNMSKNGIKRVMMRAVDTDVLLLSITLYGHLSLDQLWIDFGSGKNRCFIPVHKVVLDPIKKDGLRFFFAFTGCDQVSFFSHVSKATAWKVWKLFPDVSTSFALLSNRPTQKDIEKCLASLERFVVLLYHRTFNCTDVNSCRRELFCHGRAIENIPPTQNALQQRTRMG